LGNILSSLIFRIASGEAVKDTQSGLRGFPSALLAELGALDGERYEYETSVLMHLCRHGHAPLQVPISTIYLDANRSSHFEPMRDSMRIGFVLLRYSVSSLIAAGIDFTVFAAVFWMTRSILSSLIVGRVSSLANFTLNKRFVFNYDVIIRGSLGRYCLLALVIATLSYTGTRGFSENLHWNVLVAKVVSDTILFIASFSIQRTFVFPLGEKE
jgi:putative flippase GtrA